MKTETSETPYLPEPNGRLDRQDVNTRPQTEQKVKRNRADQGSTRPVHPEECAARERPYSYAQLEGMPAVKNRALERVLRHWA